MSALYIKGFGIYTSVAPSFNYQATQRLNVEIGTSVISGMNSFSPPIKSANSTLPQPSNQYFIFGHGNYLLTDKLILTGSFYKSANTGSNQANPNLLNYKGFDFGFNYKLSKNMEVGAQFKVADGLNWGLTPSGYNSSSLGW